MEREMNDNQKLRAFRQSLIGKEVLITRRSTGTKERLELLAWEGGWLLTKSVLAGSYCKEIADALPVRMVNETDVCEIEKSA